MNILSIKKSMKNELNLDKFKNDLANMKCKKKLFKVKWLYNIF